MVKFLTYLSTLIEAIVNIFEKNDFFKFYERVVRPGT